jgi:hypothetical protein
VAERRRGTRLRIDTELQYTTIRLRGLIQRQTLIRPLDVEHLSDSARNVSKADTVTGREEERTLGSGDMAFTSGICYLCSRS